VYILKFMDETSIEDRRFPEKHHALAYLAETGIRGSVRKIWVTRPRKTYWWVIDLDR
jgi:hypothetical protein